jgi:CDP-abequose synthase
MNKTKTVIVTGASGFIGTHLVNKLLDLDYNVIAVTRVIRSESQHSNLIWVEWANLGDLLISYSSIPMAIIHLATAYGRQGESLSSVESANVIMPLQLLELAVNFKINKFINTDSFFSKPEFNYQYMRPYIISKNNFLNWGAFIATQNHLQFINMRLEHVFGPGDGKGKFIPYIVDSLINNKKQIECTDCTQKRDFIYVDDVVSAYLTVLIQDLSSGFLEFEVGYGTSVPVKDIVEEIKSKIPNSNSTISYGAINQREQEILDSKANNTALKSVGWHPIYDYKTGVSKLLADFHS